MRGRHTIYTLYTAFPLTEISVFKNILKRCPTSRFYRITLEAPKSEILNWTEVAQKAHVHLPLRRECRGKKIQ